MATRSRRLLVSVVGYAVVFTVLFWPWIQVATEAIPAQPQRHDARIIVWVLGWMAHALGTAPTRLVDAPIDYPAPAQLTGSEHLATSQLVAAPVYWMTGNAVLAANLATMASYPLGALVMERLLAALGGGAIVAWTAGLVFALGPLRVPPSVQTLQYANLFLPLVALALVRLRERPDTRRAAALAVAALLGLFASYYTAVLVLLVASVWIVLDLPTRVRTAYVAHAAGALLAALAVFTVASQPYLSRARTLGPVLDQMAVAVRDQAWRYRLELIAFARPRFGTIPLALAAAGVAGLVRAELPRRLAVAGLVFTGLGIVLALGPSLSISGVDVPLPYALIAASPARFFRIPERFLVLAGFGSALLAAAALVSLPVRMRGMAAALVAAAVLVERAPAVRAWIPDPVLDPAARAIYERVATATTGDHGGLLELPLEDRAWALLEPDAMVGQTIHHLPILTGYTGYRAAHRPLLLSLLGRLPDAEAWDALVDTTHVRWLLLRPAAAWRDGALRNALRAVAGSVAFDEDGWTLVRVGRAPQRLAWFEALSAPPRVGHTVLGTPLAALDPSQVRATLSLVDAPAPVQARGLAVLPLRVENAGRVAWPVAVPADHSPEFSVGLVAEWRSGSSDAGIAPQAVALTWDVPAGDAVRVDARVGTPPAAGDYVLSVRVVQSGTSAFADSPALDLPLVVASH